MVSLVLRVISVPVYPISLYLFHSHCVILLFLFLSLFVNPDGLNRGLSSYAFQPLLLILFPYPLRFPPHAFHVPVIRLAFRIALFLTLILLFAVFPASLLKHGPSGSLLRLPGLVFGGLLVQPLLLPFGETFRRDGREVAGQFVPFRFQKVFEREGFQGRFVHQGFLRRALLLGFQDETRRERVLVHAFVAAVGAGPEPAVFALFDGGDEVFADFVGGGFGVAVFGHDDLSEFLWLGHSSQQVA